MKSKVFFAIMLSSMLVVTSCASATSASNVNEVQEPTNVSGETKPDREMAKKENIQLAENQKMIIGKVTSVTDTAVTFYTGTDSKGEKPIDEGTTPPTKPVEIEKSTTSDAPETKEMPADEKQPVEMGQGGRGGMNITWSTETTTINLAEDVTINKMSRMETNTTLTYTDIEVEDQIRMVVETGEDGVTQTIVSIEIMSDMSNQPNELKNPIE